ncbi:MAG: DUF3466 family protein [Thalassotalea sp.]
MKKYLKSLLALSVISSTLSISTVSAATYKVEPISDLSSHEYSYGQVQNGNSQEFIISATEQYNFPVIFEFFTAQDIINIINLSLTGTNFAFGLQPIEDVEALLAGEPSGNDLAWVIRYLQSKAGDLSYQKVSGNSAFYSSAPGAVPVKINIWDESFSLQFPELTNSTKDYVEGITANGWFYGSGTAPSLPYTYSESGFDTDGNVVILEKVKWLSVFDLKAFISIDQGNTIIPVEAPLNLYGGISSILSMADVDGTQVAVGFASTGYHEASLNVIEYNGTGSDDNENGVIDENEKSGCKSASINVVEQIECIQSFRQSLYYLNAMKWKFDDNGNMIDEEILGLLITPHVDDIRYHSSTAVAINSSEVAVGYSTGWRDEEETNPAVNESVGEFAVIFKDGELIDLTPIHSELYNSKLTDINDAGIAIGHVTKLVNGVYRTKFFHVNTDDTNLELTFPDDFFKGSSSKATAINENGFIVGEGEIERHTDGGVLNTTNPRRRNAFLYDINTDTFTNLNDFLACNSGYEIIEAQDINDLNEITATALTKVPRRNAIGELVLDTDGNPLKEDIIQAVKLTPIAGEIVNCDSEEGKLIERQGASLTWLSLCLLTLISLKRRKS